MNAILKIQSGSTQLDRTLEQNRARGAIGGCSVRLDLVRAALDEAVASPDQDAFNWAMDTAERHAASMEDALLALRAELRAFGRKALVGGGE